MQVVGGENVVVHQLHDIANGPAEIRDVQP